MRNLFTRFFLTVVCCVFFLSPQAQTKKYPSTLLWRITGKGLSKPSYLFGTIHVTDRRVFYFSDSLYSCLGKADGYAMELDPDSAIAALFHTIFSEDTSGLVMDAVDRKKFSHMAKRIEAELGVPANKVTKKQLWLYSFKGGRDKKEDDMDSPVDTYLYNIARRQGKWVGGIEDVEDQISLLEDLGNKFDADALLYKADTKASLEEITGIYKAQDLDRIAAWMDNSDSSFRDNLLDKRNIKMARRIDSMAALRSIFFAIGAAHLPGKAGVISLLRARGYTVEPILSDKKIAPETYTYKAVDIPWKNIQDEEKTYSVQMPGNPFPLKLPNGITMNCYADMGTGIIYFFMALQSPTLAGNPDSILSAVGKNMARNGDVEKQEYISYQGTRGVEIYAGKSSYYYRVRTFLKDQNLYMIMTGSEKKKLVNNAESERFFASLTMPETPHPAINGKREWMAYTRPDKGFSLNLPGKPAHNKQLEQIFRSGKEAYAWNFECYTYSDPGTGNFYLITVKDTRNGYYLMNDTSAFNDTRESATANGADIISYNTFTYQGYAAAKIKADYAETRLEMQSFIVCRANRIYVILGLHEKGKGDTAAITQYFESFRLLDIPPVLWQQQTASDNSFTTWAPSAIAPLHIRDQDTSAIIFSAYDSLSTLSFEIQKQKLPPYYWTKSDSSFFAYMASAYHERWTDSLLQEHETQNGHTGSREYLFESPASNNLKRVRIIPNGDSIYAIFSHLPRQLEKDANINRLYESFRFNREQTARPWLDNKAKQLLEALHATDSATAATAREALSDAPFTSDDLPLLYQALLYPYPGEEADNPLLYHNLTRAIAKEKDSTTLSFIAAQYPLLNGEKESLKYRLLSILAQIQTTPSYTLLQKLLLQQAPKTGDPEIIKYQLTDSLALTAGLFPGLLPLSRDTLFIKIMPHLLIRLADSNRVSLDKVAPYKKDYYAFARRELNRVGTDAWNDAWLYLVKLLGRFKEAEANALLQQFLRAHYTIIKEEAAMALIKNNSPVAPARLEKIAADKDFRIDFYEKLLECGKTKLFPAVYKTQKSFAEAELYSMAGENEYDSIGIRFIGERSAVFMGKKRLFYLFNLSYNNEDGEREARLSMAGPYTTGSSKLLTHSDASVIDWEEAYDPKKINERFKKLLQDAEDAQKEEEE